MRQIRNKDGEKGAVCTEIFFFLIKSIWISGFVGCIYGAVWLGLSVDRLLVACFVDLVDMTSM